SSRSELSSYLETIDHLQRSGELEQPYRMLLIGAPARMTREFNALLDFLRADGKALPVLIMAHEQNAELTAFAQARTHTSLVLWANFSRIPGAIRTLIPDADERHEAPADAPAKAGAHGPIRILFVDDSQSVRLAYRQLLERNGFEVDSAGTLAE